MVIVADGGSPVNLSELSSVEKDIYDLKHKSATSFHYDSIDQLRFELKLRAATVKAAMDLHKSSAAFASFKKSRCNEQYWTRTSTGGFQMKTGVQPSNAIRDIFEHGKRYAFECATAVIIVLYKAVLEVVGQDVFDRLFKDLYLYSWEHDNDLRLITISGKYEAYPGDILYFKNPDVDLKFMQWQGENVVKLQGGDYFGHGIGTVKEEKIIATLNRFRKKDSKVSAYLLDEVTYPNYVYLWEAGISNREFTAAQAAAFPAAGIEGGIIARIGFRTVYYV